MQSTPLHPLPKLGVELWCTPSYIHGSYRTTSPHEVDTPFRCGSVHHFGSLWGGFHVAMVAGLVAVQPYVELENFGGRALQRGDAGFLRQAG